MRPGTPSFACYFCCRFLSVAAACLLLPPAAIHLLLLLLLLMPLPPPLLPDARAGRVLRVPGPPSTVAR